MNNKSIAIIAVLAVSVLAVVAITTPLAYASRGDSSETETELQQKQSGVGSGNSAVQNCEQLGLETTLASTLTCTNTAP